MNVRAVHITLGLLLLSAAGAAVFVSVGLPWLEAAKAVTDPSDRVESGNLKPSNESSGPFEQMTMRSNTESKGDRLGIERPVPDPTAIPSMALDTAIQFMAVPLTSVPEGTGRVATKATNALLDEQQISAIKARLKLTPAQEKYWPPVAQALREVVTVAHSGRRATIDTGHDSVKQLFAAARPFLAQLRSDQKEQIKSLMRIAGLGTQLPGAD